MEATFKFVIRWTISNLQKVRRCHVFYIILHALQSIHVLLELF